MTALLPEPLINFCSQLTLFNQLIFGKWLTIEWISLRVEQVAHNVAPVHDRTRRRQQDWIRHQCSHDRVEELVWDVVKLFVFLLKLGPFGLDLGTRFT